MTDEELDQRVRAGVLSEEIETAQLERSIRGHLKRPLVPRWALATAAGIVLAIAGGAAYRTFVKAPPSICKAAARDHSAEILSGVPRKWTSGLAAIQTLAAEQGVPGEAVAALGTTGYRLERARLCFLEKQIFLHLIYSKGDFEYSVFLRPRGSESPFDESIRQTSFGFENLAYFQTDRLIAVCVAEQSSADALAIARAAAKVL